MKRRCSWVLIWLIFILKSLTFSKTENQFLQFNLHKQFVNLFCMNGAEPIRKEASLARCGRHCTVVSGCTGIFYNNITNMCSVVKILSEPEVGCTQQTGSKYYYRIYNDAFGEYTFTPADQVRLTTETVDQVCNSYSFHSINTDIDARLTRCGDATCCQSKGCYIGQYQRYHGTWSTTVYGRKCQRWDQQTPHSHIRDSTGTWYDGETPQEAHNYCRDPDYSGYLWCYTMDPNHRWESCGIPACP